MNIELANTEALQKEVFHRVSNNFQIMQSMIRLVSRDGSIADKAKELEERIQMLSLAHHALHSLEDACLHPVEVALPNLVEGAQSSGFLVGREVTCNVEHTTLSVQRTYALMHIVIEALRTLDRTVATRITIHVDADALRVSSDTVAVIPSETSQKLASAFARELGTSPVWTDDGLVAKLK